MTTQIIWLVSKDGEIQRGRYGDVVYEDYTQAKEFIDYMKQGFPDIEWKVIKRTIVEEAAE